MDEQKGALQSALIAVIGTTGGGILSLANPEGADLIITKFVLNITTEATGAATGDFGVAANGTTSSDTLLDGVDLGAAAAIFDNVDDQGTNGQSVLLWGSSQYITGTASATLAGLVGYAYVEYIRV